MAAGDTLGGVVLGLAVLSVWGGWGLGEEALLSLDDEFAWGLLRCFRGGGLGLGGLPVCNENVLIKFYNNSYILLN